MIYKITQFIVRVLFLVFFRLKVKGLNNIPCKGPFILASNHYSNLDPMVLGVSISRQVNFLAKKELFKIGFIGWFLQKVGAFPLKRDTPDIGAFRKSLDILNRGLPLVMFPQGTRGSQEVRKGIGVLAKRSKAPVIPVKIFNTAYILPPGSKMPRLRKIKVSIGKPLIFADSVSSEEIADIVFSKIK